MYVSVAPLFDVLVAVAAWISGFGNPSPAHVARVVAFTPPVLGAATLVLVYAVARLSAGGLTGLLAAYLLTWTSGAFLVAVLATWLAAHAMLQ